MADNILTPVGNKSRLGAKVQPTVTSWSCGVVVITSALHAEGPQFDPGRDQNNFNFVFEQQS